MRTIIAGSRSYSKQDKGETLDDFIKRLQLEKRRVFETLDEINGYSTTAITTVICGLAKGPDVWGKQWAESRGIPVEDYPADWSTYGKAAGMIRNREMAMVSDQLVVFWDGTSRGTRNMVEQAAGFNLKIHVR